MNGELPVCKRCCFCLPLRYGLIAWGYFKLIAATFFITVASYILYCTVLISRLYGNEKNRYRFDADYATGGIMIIILLVDFVLTTVYIVGGHKKNVKLLRVFYYYSIVVWVLMILFIAVVVGFSIDGWSLHYQTMRSSLLHLIDFSIYFLNIAIQAYFLLLLRSEIIKLRNNCEFRFVNNATEAECTMKYDEDIAAGETETQDV